MWNKNDVIMINENIKFPTKQEYPVYAEMYMKWCAKDGSLLKQLDFSLLKTMSLVRTISNEKVNLRSAKGKWSIKEILIHMIDDERIYAYRALAFARGDKRNLPGFNQDEYILNSDSEARTIDNIMQEYDAVRSSTITLFNGFSKVALTRKGVANGNQVSVRALGYYILGHELHHINFIEKNILKRLKIKL